MVAAAGTAFGVSLSKALLLLDALHWVKWVKWVLLFFFELGFPQI